LKGADFWQLSSKKLLPEETRKYVPAVLAAMKRFVNDPDELGSRGIWRHVASHLPVSAKVVYATTSATD
jgi:hypothetical protein